MTITQDSPRQPPRGEVGDPRDTPVKIFLVMISVGGVIAVPTFFLQPSMPRNAVLLGYSLPRLLMGSAFLLVEIGLACTTLLVLARPGLVRRVLEPIDSKTADDPSFMVALLLLLLYVAVVAGYLLVLFSVSLVPHVPYLMQVLMEKALGVLLWLTAMPGLLAVALAFRYSRHIGHARRRPSGIESRLALFLVITPTTLHWITLALQAQWVFRIEGWFWEYTPKVFRPSFVFIPAVVAFALVAAFVIIRQGHLSSKHAGVLLLTAYILQIGFGFALGQGFESIRLRYEHAPISDEMRLACGLDTTTLAALKDYEQALGQSFWYETKPPGLLAIYSLSRDILGIWRPGAASTSAACFLALSAALAPITPFLSALVVVPIIGLERLIRPGPRPIAASLLYMAAPSILLMHMVPDQWIYPLVSAVVMLAVVMATLRGSWPLALLAGFLMGVQVFISFSLLPLVGLALAWLALLFVSKRLGSHRIRLIRAGVALVVGFLVLSGLLAGVLDYNPVARFTTAMRHHREIKAYDSSLEHVIQYGLLNNVEIAFWGGLPLTVLAIMAVARSVRPMLAGSPSLQDTFNISFAAMFIAMDAFGQTRGEVGRIWIFLLPMGAIVGASQASRLLRDPVRSLMLVLALQLITSMFAFAYLDWH